MGAKTESSRASGGGVARVAVFGKHPAWDDHIDDINLETDRLAWVKRRLYSEGIGALVASGAWEALETGGRLPGFDHGFVWRFGDALVAGRVWSSSDGKGRTKFPMVACAQFRGPPAAFSAARVLPRLVLLQRQCEAARALAEVDPAAAREAVAERTRDADEEIARATAAEPPASKGSRLPPAAITVLSEHPSLGGAAGGGRRGFLRVMYQLERDFGAFHRGAFHRAESGSTATRDPSARARHLRVPRLDEVASEGGSGAGLSGEEVDLWLRLLLFRLDPSAPMLLVGRPGAPWVDLVVGDPGPDELACLRASPDAVPLSTEIPYSIESGFVSLVDEWVTAGRTGRLVDHDPGRFGSGSGSRVLFGAGVGFASDKAGDRGGGAAGPGAMWPWVVVALVVVSAVLAAAVFAGEREGASDGTPGGGGERVGEAEGGGR